MSSDDAAWTAWAEKAAAEYNSKPKPGREARRLAAAEADAQMSMIAALAEGAIRDQRRDEIDGTAKQLAQRQALLAKCDRILDQNIKRYRASEQGQLAKRLAEAVNTQALIRWQLAVLVREAEPYLEQDNFSDTTKAERVAMALLALRDAMLDAQECQDIDEADALPVSTAQQSGGAA